MNKSMVDAFSAKQELIQQRNLRPDIKAYKVALGYGRREKLNSFMAKIDSEILPAREAWSEITGLEYSPEIVFAIAGLIPRFFGVQSIVSAAMNPREVCLGENENNSQFNSLFENSFSPIILSEEANREIELINSTFTQ